jgi:hypothetical protein
VTSRSSQRPAGSLATLLGLLLAAGLGASCSSADTNGGAPPSGDAGAAGDSGSAPPADAAPCVGVDIKDRLACIPGLTVAEITDDPDAAQPVVPAGYRRFDLALVQPVDHDDPKSPTFTQRLSLLHVSETAPMVLASSGYGLSTGRGELTRTFTSNQIQVEHRFFAPSVPVPPQWTDLTIRQSAADYHAIVAKLKPIYGGHWVNTGASKGGMTSVYHRRFYPGDLDGTVAYVAPNVYGTEDARFVAFLSQVGGAAYAACRAAIVELQKTVLTRRDEITPLMQGTYDRLGGKPIALEHAVLEMPFTFWQYTDPADAQSGCGAIPAAGAPIATLFGFFAQVTQLGNYGDTGFDYFAPYYYQAATELGAPGVDDAPIASLLRYRATYSVTTYAPKGVPTVFDPAAMVDVATWVKTDGVSLMFIYGEYDPWSAGAFALGAARDSFVYVAAGKNHGAKLTGLTSAEKQTALSTLERWMGATATNPPALVGGARDFTAGDPELEGRPRL